MNSNDLIGALKGTVKTVNLSQLINQKQQEFKDWVVPYYQGEQLKAFEKRKEMYANYFEFVYCEPDWPKGQIRSLSKKFNQKKAVINHLCKIHRDLIQISFPDYEDDDGVFSIDRIVIRKLEAAE